MAITMLMGGGLGNQMFQYAAGRSLSARWNTDLVLDLRYYANVSDRQTKAFALASFPIDATITDYSTGLHAHHPLRRLMRKVVSERPGQIYREPELTFDRAFFELPDGTKLTGGFHSWRYFDDVADTLVRELTPTLDVPSTAYGQPLADCVAVHVRRGDYLTTAGFAMQDFEGYYRRALQMARQWGPLLVFSDDPQWCRSAPLFEGASVYETPRGAPAAHDLLAMSRCGGLVIANSSYSWWAAWLAWQRGARVITPTQWIMGRTVDEMQMSPPDWVRLS